MAKKNNFQIVIVNAQRILSTKLRGEDFHDLWLCHNLAKKISGQEIEEYDLDEIVEEENLEWKIQVSLMWKIMSCNIFFYKKLIFE